MAKSWWVYLKICYSICLFDCCFTPEVNHNHLQVDAWPTHLRPERKPTWAGLKFSDFIGKRLPGHAIAHLQTEPWSPPFATIWIGQIITFAKYQPHLWKCQNANLLINWKTSKLYKLGWIIAFSNLRITLTLY